jgi:hypothetical protein
METTITALIVIMLGTLLGAAIMGFLVAGVFGSMLGVLCWCGWIAWMITRKGK